MIKQNKKKLQIGVIGYAGKEEYSNGVKPSDNIFDLAEEVGFLLAKQGVVVVTGGKGGVMERSAKGAKKAGGLTVGVISGGKRFKSNKFTDVEILTGMDSKGLDEIFLVLMCDALITIGGGAGTLQEITVAYRNKKPVIILENSGGWSEKIQEEYLDERRTVQIKRAKSPEEAVKLAIKNINKIYAEK